MACEEAPWCVAHYWKESPDDWQDTFQGLRAVRLLWLRRRRVGSLARDRARMLVPDSHEISLVG